MKNKYTIKRTKRITHNIMCVSCLLIILILFFSDCKDSGISPSITPPDSTYIPSDSTWTLLGLGNESITAIALHPIDSRIVYAGSSSDFSAGIGGKLFKSVDYGKTWDTIYDGGSAKISAIIIDPRKPQTIYVAPWGIIKSDDGGNTWYEADNGIRLDWEKHVQALVMDPFDSNVLYAGTGGPGSGGLYKSTDAGTNWTWIGDSLRDGVISLAIASGNSNVIYAGTPWRGILWKSTDAGSSWSQTGLGMTNLLVSVIAVNPNNNNIIYAGVSFTGLLKSSDGVNTWTKENLPDSATECVDIKFNPSNAFDIYAAMYGIYNQRCQGCPWREMNEGFSNNYAINVIEIGNNKYLYAGRSNFTGNNGGIFVRKIAE